MTKKLLTALALVLMLGAAFGAWRLRQRVDGEVFDSGGVPIHYTVTGEGEPLVLIHGFAMDQDLEWRGDGYIEDGLAEHYRVIAIDNRGHGNSGRPMGPERYGTHMVKDVVRLLDHLGIERARVFGYSMGGMITLKLIVTHPERVERAVVGGMGWVEYEGDMPLEEIGAAMDSGDMSTLTRNLAPPDEAVSEAAVLGAGLFFRAMAWRNDPRALGDVVRSWSALQVSEEELRTNRVATLVFVGTRDPLQQYVERLDGVMANAQVLYHEGGTHGDTKGSPAVREAVSAFLR